MLDQRFKKELMVLGVIAFLTLSSFYFADKQKSVDAFSALIDYYAQNVNLGNRTQAVDCQINGPLPDKNCTPGTVFEDATPEQICVKGYTQTVRNVSTSLKKRIYEEYSLSYPEPSGAYEADHLIPLELGGSNDIANLFPEAAEPRPGFHEKDLVENFLNHEMCAGRIDLKTAQKMIADNWVAVYQTLTASQITSLKSEFPSQF